MIKGLPVLGQKLRTKDLPLFELEMYYTLNSHCLPTRKSFSTKKVVLQETLAKEQEDKNRKSKIFTKSPVSTMSFQPAKETPKLKCSYQEQARRADWLGGYDSFV